MSGAGSCRSGRGVWALTALCLFLAGPAKAVDLFGRDTISGLIDVRMSGADREPSFMRGGFGKSAASGAGSGFAFRPQLDLAAVAWRPELADNLTAYVLVQNQPGQSQGVGLAEAYLQYRPLPVGGVRVNARAGLMWPPISLEHDGTAWSVTRTLTPSAINTWVAEEVKVLGGEATVSGALHDHTFSATASVFEDNDTSGTLLTYRGWGLHDIRTTAFATLPLPRAGGAVGRRTQAYVAEPSLELDGRPGWYAKLEWRPPAPVALSAFYYDNCGDPHVLQNGQWGWRTTFANLGLLARPAADVEVLAQAMVGRTYFGFDLPSGWYTDVDFSSAYVLATKRFGAQRLSARLDAMRVHDRVSRTENHDERGWAATADYLMRLNRSLTLGVEAQQIWSNRPSRARLRSAPTQNETMAQLALRAAF